MTTTDDMERESTEPLRRPSFSTRDSISALESRDSVSAFEMEVRDAFEMREHPFSPDLAHDNEHAPARSGQYASVAQDERDIQKTRAHITTDPHNAGLKQLGLKMKDVVRKDRSLRLTRAAAFWTDTWVAEVLSCLLAILALVGLTVTLSIFDKKPLNDYSLKLSLNTIVAVFSAVVKAALLMPVAESISQLKWLWFAYAKPLLDFVDFDLASRGPWGSILLLIRLHSSHLASIGAWITIAALAIDPFSQQIIQYYPCSHNLTSATALIPRVNNYTGGAAGRRVNGSFADTFANLNAGMSAAVYIGLLDAPQNSSSNVQVVCSTGNCTFPFDISDGATYQTLAFGTECAEKTSEAAKDKSPENPDGTVIDAYSLSVNGDNRKVVFTDRQSTVVDMESTADLMVNFTMLMMNINWEACKEWGSSPNMLAHCTPSTGMFAAECSLFPKVQTFNASVVNGTLYEKLIAEEKLSHVQYGELSPEEGDAMDPITYPWTYIAKRTLRDGMWQNCTASDQLLPNNTVLAHPDRLPDPSVEETGLLWYPADCIWVIDDMTTEALTSFLVSMFNGSMAMQWGTSGISFNGDPWVLNLYNNGTANITFVENYFRGLGDAMSAYIRNWGSGGTEAYATGEAYIMQTCIAVEWWWMSFPAALTLASLLFLGATYWRTVRERTGVGNWKSFTLADLFSGLDEEIRGRYGRLDKKSAMQDIASEIKVKLVLTDAGWRLKEVDREWKVDDESKVSR